MKLIRCWLLLKVIVEVSVGIVWVSVLVRYIEWKVVFDSVRVVRVRVIMMVMFMVVVFWVVRVRGVSKF